MDDLLELPQVRRLVSRLSVADYHDLCEASPRLIRTELVRGIIVEKVRRTPQHSFIATVLCRILSAQEPDGIIVRNSSALTFSDSELEPDLSLVRGGEWDFAHAHPTTAELSIEIATGGAEIERELIRLYAEADVQESWIVLAPPQQVEVYRHPEGGHYRDVRTYSRDQTLVCESVPEIRVELAGIFPS